MHAGSGTGEQVGLAHVAGAVAEKGEGLARQIATVFANREQVGEQLAGVEVVAERVDDGHRGAERHFFEPGLAVGAPDDRGDLAFEHAGSVGGGFLAAELAVRGADDERAASEVGDADGEGYPGAGGGLVENDRDGLRTSERAHRESISLQLQSQIENLGLFGRGDIVIAQEMAGHGVTFGCRCSVAERMPLHRLKITRAGVKPAQSGIRPA